MKCSSIFSLSLLAVTPLFASNALNPIKLTLHDWSQRQMAATLMDEVYTVSDNHVSYTVTDYIAQFTDLKKRDQQDVLGTVTVIGQSDTTAIEKWWYPTYMYAHCPSLSSREILNDCATKLVPVGTTSPGHYLSGAVTYAYRGGISLSRS